jgi:Icc-related predicted phosphoesterase
MSDSHGRHENIYVLKRGEALNQQDTLNNITGGVYLPVEADMIIHSGDLSMRGTEFEIDKFLKWYSSLPYKYKILICGNHDFLFEKQRTIAQELLARYPNITYLESSEVVIEGIKIYGEPRQPWFHDWAFNVERGEKIKRYWDAIPDDTDILVTHGPPKGILDMTMRGDQVGCEDLLQRIWELKNLRLCQFGHIHEDAGYEFISNVHFVNASVLNLRYQLQNRPMIFEIDENKNITKI